MSNYSKRSTAKSIISVIALLLVLVLVVGLVGCLATSTNPKDWFEKPPAIEDNENNDNGDDVNADANKPKTTNVIVSSDENATPFAMTFSAATLSEEDENVVIVPMTVTPNPENANITLVWYIAFSDANSTWASGKNVTDYAEVEPSEEDIRSANLIVKEAFGEQLIVTAALREDTSITVTATVDYVKRVSVDGYQLLQRENGNYGYGTFIKPTLIYSEGTMCGDENISFSVSLADRFYALMRSVDVRVATKINVDRFDANLSPELIKGCTPQGAVNDRLEKFISLAQIKYDGSGGSKKIIAGFFNNGMTDDLYAAYFCRLFCAFDPLMTASGFRAYSYVEHCAMSISDYKLNCFDVVSDSDKNACINGLMKLLGKTSSNIHNYDSEHLSVPFLTFNVSVEGTHNNFEKSDTVSLVYRRNMPTYVNGATINNSTIVI